MGRIDAKRRNPKVLSPSVRSVSDMCVIDVNDYDPRLVLVPTCKVYRVRAVMIRKRHRCATAALTTFNVDVNCEDLEAGTSSTIVDTSGTFPTGSVLQNANGVVETFFCHVDAGKCWKQLHAMGDAASTRRTADTNLQLLFSSGNYFASNNDGRVPSATQDKAPNVIVTYTPGSATAVNANVQATLFYEPMCDDDLDAIL